jgi:hypothetical protein
VVHGSHLEPGGAIDVASSLGTSSLLFTLRSGMSPSPSTKGTSTAAR